MNSHNLSRLSYDVFLAARKHFAMDTMSYGQGKGSYLQVKNLPAQKWACSTVQFSHSVSKQNIASHQHNFFLFFFLFCVHESNPTTKLRLCQYVHLKLHKSSVQLNWWNLIHENAGRPINYFNTVSWTSWLFLGGGGWGRLKTINK